MVITAQCTGIGTVVAVNWYYSGQLSGNKVNIPKSCTLFGSAEPRFPSNCLTYSCDTITNTCTTTLYSFDGDDDKKEWGAAFSVEGEVSKIVMKKN